MSQDPFSGHEQAGLGGGVYEPTFEDVVDNIKALAGRIMGPVLLAWLACAAIDLVFVLLVVGSTFALATTEFAAYGLMAITGVTVIVGIFVGAIRASLYGPIKVLMTQGPAAIPDLGALVQIITPRLVPVLITTILTGIVVGIGIVMCVIPGLVAAFFLVMAPYYAATGTAPIQAMTESFETAKRNWMLLLMVLGVALFVFGGIALVSSIATTISVAALGQYAYIGSNLATWVLNATLGAVFFVIGGAIFVTVDTAESGERIVH